MKLTVEKKATFLDVLRNGSSVTAAASAINISTVALYAWRKKDPAFALEWDAAVDSGTDLLEDEARRRALKVSDTLLIFLLKGRRPEKFRDNMKVQFENIESEIERELARLAGRAEDSTATSPQSDSNTVH